MGCIVLAFVIGIMLRRRKQRLVFDSLVLTDVGEKIVHNQERNVETQDGAKETEVLPYEAPLGKEAVELHSEERRVTVESQS